MPTSVFSQNALTRLGMHNAGAVGAGSYTSRTKATVRVSGFGLRLYWTLAYPTGASTQETAYSGNTTIKAALELSDGTILFFYFNGARTITVAGGGIVCTDLLGVALTAGDVVWLRVYISNATALYLTDYPDHINGEGYMSGVDQVDSGVVTVSGGYAFTPQLATLQVQNLGNGVVLFGDSIVGATLDVFGGGGYLTRAFTATHPTLNLGNSSEGVNNFLNQAQTKNRMALAALSGAEYAVLSWTNDPYQGRTLSQYQADIRTAVDRIAAYGLKVLVCTLTPRTTSTDGWKTTANQSIITPAFDAVRLAINAWLRTEFRSSNLVGIADVAAIVETNSLWKAPAGGITDSGTVTSTIAGVCTDNTKTWTSQAFNGYIVRNDTLGGAGSMIARTQTTNVLTTGAVVFTIGNAYSIYPGATIDGIHPVGEFHRLMAAGFPPAIIAP